MPRVEVVFYQEAEEEVPVLDWLKELRCSNLKTYETCIAAIERLGELGHELRRPLADFLRDGIHELRIRKGRVNYRILYFFYGRSLAVLAHALVKEDLVPESDIERALRRKRVFEADQERHTYSEEEA
ncbi:MAG: type II toxin-antitoxin system RelE/ParE family toxin [Acidobacteria bacterium]|nr:type II toxin-antitoxin system RelE/ParE family toxin [Acidobacteriota bacterium]